MITFDDFKKLEIKIGTVRSAEKIEGADRLLKLVMDFGTETRELVSGIAPFYPDPLVLVGKQLPVLMNLEPRVIRGHTSEGMVLYAVETTEGGEKLTTLEPALHLLDGSVVR